jgi:Ca2+-binding RTX toxin-like protein
MSLPLKTPALTSLLIGLASLLGVAPAHAAVTKEVLRNTLIVRGDGQADTINLGVVGDKISVNGESTTLVADDGSHITVVAGAGADTVDASQLAAGTYQSLLVEGGEGADRIDGGGSNGDVLSGDGNDDTLTGGKGRDEIFGGDGDDTMIWNNGDGSDEASGDGGDDLLMVNGNPTAEAYAYREGERAAWVLLSRAADGEGRGAFSIESISTDLVVNGLAGNDSFEATTRGPFPTPGLAGLMQLTVNGGAGDDTIRGGDGDDVLNGNEGVDRVAGREGDDTVDAGEGNDEIFWSEGDGEEEEVVGGPGQFDRLVVVGSETAADEFELVAGPTTRVERTNPTPLTINLPGGQGEVEEVSINPAGGDDVFTASPGLPDMLIQADGGPGDDVIGGGDGPDQLFGGEGNDEIGGGAGGDVLSGETGNDEIGGGDGNEFIRGGDGADRLSGDRGRDGVFGDSGDDVIFWSDADGDEAPAGEAGVDRLQVSLLGTGNDEIELRPGALERTNLTPFILTLPVGGEEFEEVAVNAESGNDTLVVAPGLGGEVVATGGPGSDSLRGSDEIDRFAGNFGNDLLDGAGGDDRFLARDREADVVRGGAGDDSAQTDELTVDVVDGVEQLDATPTSPPEDPPPPMMPPPVGPPPAQPPVNRPPVQPPPVVDDVALLPKLGKIAVSASDKKLVAKVPVSCPAAETDGCRTTLKLEAKSPRKVLGSKTVRVGAGAKATASIQLSAGAAKLAVNGKLPVRIRITSTDAAGNTASKTISVTLKVPR